MFNIILYMFLKFFFRKEQCSTQITFRVITLASLIEKQTETASKK